MIYCSVKYMDVYTNWATILLSMNPCIFMNIWKVHAKKESSFSGQVHLNKIWVVVFLDDMIPHILVKQKKFLYDQNATQFHIKVASTLSATVNKYIIMTLIFIKFYYNKISQLKLVNLHLIKQIFKN